MDMAYINELAEQHDEIRLSAQPDSAWQRDDRAWFAVQLCRGYRLRETFEGESTEQNPYMIVRRVDIDLRAKMNVFCADVPTTDLDLLTGPSALADAVLAMLWEAVRTGATLPLNSIVAQARVLHSKVRH